MEDQWSTCSCEEDSLILLNLDAAGVVDVTTRCLRTKL